MRRTTGCLALVLAMLSVPLAADDYRSNEQLTAPGSRVLQAAMTWVLGLVPGQVERTAPDVHQKFGSDGTVDGSAAPVVDPPIDDGPIPFGSDVTVDG